MRYEALHLIEGTWCSCSNPYYIAKGRQPMLLDGANITYQSSSNPTHSRRLCQPLRSTCFIKKQREEVE
jgi:hypothetical protein